MLVCGLSLFGLLPVLRLLAAARPDLAAPWKAAADPAGVRNLAAFPELARTRLLSIDYHGLREGTPFLDLKPLDAVAAASGGALTVNVDPCYPHSAAIMARFDCVLYVLEDVRNLLWRTSAARLFAQEGRLPDARRIKQAAAEALATFPRYWNENVLSHLVNGAGANRHVVRLEDLAGDLPGQWAGLAARAGGRLPGDREPDGPSAGFGRAGLPIPGALDGELEARCLEACGPVLEQCGYDVRPGGAGRIVGAPSATCDPETVRGLLRSGGLRTDIANQLMCRLAPEQAHTVVAIPARSGSRRVVGKNIADVGGAPLMALTIRFARSLPGVDMVVVNTDDARYAEIARRHGAQTPFLRPKEMAGDTASLGDASEYCLRRLILDGGIHVGKFVTMYPTTPLRNRETVLGMLEALDTHPFVSSCLRVEPAWQDLFVETPGGLAPVSGYLRQAPPRGGLYKLTGCFDGRSFVHDGYGLKLVPLDNPFEAIDVDKAEDIGLVRSVASWDGALEGVAPC